MAEMYSWAKRWFEPSPKATTPSWVPQDGGEPSVEDRVDTGEAAQDAAPAEVTRPVRPHQTKEGKIVDWEWSPLSAAGALIGGAAIGAATPSKVKEAYKASKEDIKTRYATQHPVWSAVTDVAEAVSGAGQVAAAVLLPAPVEQVRRPVETTPIPPEVTEKFPTFMQGWMKDWDQTPGYKDIETDSQADRALKTGIALGSGAVGGTAGLVESLVDPDTTVETLVSRPFTVGTTLLPAAKALRKGVQSVRGVKTAPIDTPGATPPASEVGVQEYASVSDALLTDTVPVGSPLRQGAASVGNPAVGVWQGIRDVVGDKAKGALDTYKQAFVDGFESGDPRATALAQKIATAPERAVDLINDWAGQIGRTALEDGKRVPETQRIPTRQPIPTIERPSHTPLSPEAAELFSTSAERRGRVTLGADRVWQAEVHGKAVAADIANREAIRAATDLPTPKPVTWAITPEGGVLASERVPGRNQNLIGSEPVYPLEPADYVSRVGEPAIKGQTYSAAARQAIDRAVADLSDQLGADPVLLQKMIEGEFGKTLMGDAAAALRENPKVAGKALLAAAEKQLNRKLTSSESRAYLEKILDPGWVDGTYAVPEFHFTGTKVHAGKTTPRTTGGTVRPSPMTLISDASLPKLIAQATAKAMDDMAKSQMPERIAAEAQRVAVASPEAINRVTGYLAQILRTTPDKVDPKMAQWIAGLDKSLKEGNLLNQVIPYDPAVVGQTLRSLYPKEGTREAIRIADHLGGYVKKDGVWMQPLFEKAIALHTMEPVGANFLQAATQHMKGSATAHNVASGVTNVLGNAGFGSIRRGVPATALFAKGLSLLRETGDYLNGGEVRPELRQALSDLAGTGALTNDFLREIKGKAKDLSPITSTGENVKNFLTGKGGVVNTALEKFYEMGDKPFRLEESIAHWENYRKALGKLVEGEEITLDQGRRHPRIRKDDLGYSIADDMAPNVADRNWKPLTEQQLGREIGKAAAHRGTALTLNYGDLPGWAKLVRNLPDVGVLSSFASWASLAMDVPGRKGHWAKTLDSSPFDIPSTSKAVMRDSAIENAGLALRRAAMASAAEQGIIQHGQADILFEKLNSRDRTALAHQLSDPSLYSGLDLGGWAATGPTGALVRLLGWGYKKAQGWDASTPDLTPQQRDLVYRAESGQLGGMKDALALVNMGGSILAGVAQDWFESVEDPTKNYGMVDAAQDMLPLGLGVTAAKILQGAAGYLADPQGSQHPRLDDLAVALAGAKTPEERVEALKGYTQTMASLRKFSGRKPESEAGVADPIGLWIARGIWGKAWMAKGVADADPETKGSFLNRAVLAMKAGAGVQSDEKHEAEIANHWRLVDSSPDAETKQTRMALLEDMYVRQARDAEINLAIETVAQEIWDRFSKLSDKLGVK